jgi:cysteine desulfurase
MSSGARVGVRPTGSSHVRPKTAGTISPAVSFWTGGVEGPPVRTIYLDHNATTATDQRVVDAMLPYFSLSYGNPSSPYSLAQESRRAIEDARETVARALGCDPRAIIFTSGGSESDNIVVKGVALANLDRRGHVVTTRIEHHAVLRACEYARDRLGFDLTLLDVDRFGRVDPDLVARACRKDTVLITVMQANNEVGTIQPIEEIARIARSRGILFHTDAVQAVGKIATDVGLLDVDFLSLSAHKFYGPKGVGALYARHGARFDPLAHGGNHEWGMRPGTENVPGIVGLAAALALALDGLDREAERLGALTSRLEAGILATIPEVSVNGHRELRIPGTTNIAFHFVEGESIVLALDMEGIAVSTGSACTTGSAEPSHVLSAMGVPPADAQGSVRFGLGRENTIEDVEHVLAVLPGIIGRLRGMSPLYRRSGP